MTMPSPGEPTIVELPAQPYVAVRGSITMTTFAAIADRFPEVFGFLGARGIIPADAPVFRYRLIDMERELVVEAGVPVAEPVAGEGEVLADVLPAGRYVTVTHVGHPDQLIARTGELLQWAQERGLTWDMTETPDGQEWGCRLERLLTDPAQQPDMNKWETGLAFRLAD
jgi:effector-binding domain-containing protein